jgi:hypothetical protein
VKSKKPNKKSLRGRLSSDIERFLQRGGEITPVPKGLTGIEAKNGVPAALPELFTSPAKGKQQYLVDVVKRLDERKQSKHSRPAPPPKREPKKVAIYDDFGEVIRYEWQ